MIIQAIKVKRWKETKIPHPAMPCGLCGRSIKTYAPCMTAIWQAQAGEYVQAYHNKCADIVMMWGYPLKTICPAEAEKWARKIGCAECGERQRCANVYVYDCEKALQEIIHTGAMYKDEWKEQYRGR